MKIIGEKYEALYAANDENKYKLYTLVPKDNIETNIDKYLTKILEDDKIKNIAITGPYSSGKTSLIDTTLKNYNHLKCIKISLAKLLKDSKQLTTNEIEKYIIEKIENSCEKKENKRKNILKAIGIGICLISLLFSIFFSNIDGWWCSYSPRKLLIRIVPFCLSTLALIVIFLEKIYPHLKLKIIYSDLEIDVTKNDESPILSNFNHINELIKLNNINLVIFEDLDRLNNYDIFDHLRDLNINLNANKKRNVKFIYEVRDNIYTAESKGKFFDIVIPIVPYISFESSSEKLNEFIKDNNLNKEFSSEFIFNICRYINDVRVLTNIFNDFCIYKESLNQEEITSEKLFAMLTYKEYFPIDYYNLIDGKGFVHYILNNKNFLKSKIIEKLRKEKNYNKRLYERIKNEYYTKDIIEKIKDEIWKYVDKDILLIFSFSEDKYIIIQRNESIDKYLYDMLEGKISFSDSALNGFYLLDILKNTNKSLYEEIDFIEGAINNKAETIIEGINRIDDTIEKLDYYSLKELFEKYPYIEDSVFSNKVIKQFLDKDESNEIIHMNFLKFAIESGYIDENYPSYINRFINGTFTKSDNDFITKLRDNAFINIDFKIDNPDKVIYKLTEFDFTRNGIININIINNLNLVSRKKGKLFFENLYNQRNKFKELFENYYNMIDNKYDFLDSLIESNNPYYRSITTLNNRDKILFDIFDKIHIKKLKRNIDYLNYINYYINSSVLRDLYDDNQLMKIKELKLKLNDLSNFYNNYVLDFIIKNNFYSINKENIYKILNSYFKVNSEEINYKLVESIFRFEILKNTIINNFGEFVDNCYSEFQSQYDNENVIIEILNNSSISKEIKEKYLMKQKYKIVNIESINEDDDKKIAVKNNIIESSMDNIYKYIELFEIDKIIINYINNNELLYEKNEKYRQVIIKIFKNIDLNIEKIDPLTKCLTDTLDINTIESIYQSNNNVVIELLKYKIVEYSSYAFNVLINLIKNKDLIIYIKNNSNGFNKSLRNNEIDVDFSLIKDILNSNIISKITKYLVVKKIKSEDIAKIDVKSAYEIYNLAIKTNYEVRFEILSRVIMFLNENEKVKLINKSINYLNKKEIVILLKLTMNGYEKILIDKCRPKFEYTEENKKLMDKLKQKGFNINYDINNKKIVVSGNSNKIEALI